jgi:hypothetical protein
MGIDPNVPAAGPPRLRLRKRSDDAGVAIDENRLLSLQQRENGEEFGRIGRRKRPGRSVF